MHFDATRSMSEARDVWGICGDYRSGEDIVERFAEPFRR
jgi:hypothetical protein